jgi:hypothetical protein
MVYLGRVLDTHPDSVNVSRFLNFVEQNAEEIAAKAPYIDTAERVRSLVRGHRAMLDGLRSETDKLEVLRNRRYAHRDSRVFEEDLAAFALNGEALHQLFKTVATMLYGYWGFEGVDKKDEFLGEDDIEHVLSLLDTATRRLSI